MCSKDPPIESPSSEKFVSSDLAIQSLKKMKFMRVSETLTDVVLITSKKEIPAHRIVLSASSDYFHAMFTNDLIESKMDKISLHFVDGPSVEKLIDFCYCGEINLEEENVETLLKTAKFLHVNEVVNACCNFLISRLDPSNCIGFTFFAESLGCKEFYDAAFSYVMEHFPQITENHEYFSITASELKSFLSNDMLNIDSEEIAFNSLMLWINFDLAKRKPDLPGLLAEIKLPLLSPQFLSDSIETYSSLRDDPKIYNLLLEAMQYHLLPERRCMMQSSRTRPRKSTVGTLFMVGGMDGGKGSWSIEQYKLRTNTWSRFGNMTSRRLQFGAAVIDNKLYVVGGRDGLKTLNIVECYDFKEHIWAAMPSMSTHRHGLGVGVLGGPMYAVGGHDGWTYLNAVERWDPLTKQWSYVAPLNTQRSTAGVAVLNDRLFAVGGRDGSSCLRSVESFDPHRNRWTYCPPMSIRRGGAGVGVINGYLFALGGHDAPILNPGVSRFECVERFDPRTDTWTLVAPMKIGRDAIGVGVLGNRLIAVGGYDGQNYLKIVEAYDPETNEWEELKELENGRAGMCVVVKL